MAHLENLAEASSPLDEVLDDDFNEPLYSRGFFDVVDREDYRPGGFHTVHLGDIIGKDNRFRVIHKLGNGGLSTVWLCRDTEKNKYVALKIIIADASKEDDCSELKLVNREDLDFNQAGESALRCHLTLSGSMD
jgi:serine/threonine-protein kinase SRPK3